MACCLTAPSYNLNHLTSESHYTVLEHLPESNFLASAQTTIICTGLQIILLELLPHPSGANVFINKGRVWIEDIPMTKIHTVFLRETHLPFEILIIMFDSFQCPIWFQDPILEMLSSKPEGYLKCKSCLQDTGQIAKPTFCPVAQAPENTRPKA